jgi:putative hydrolase of the HAD superfamily
VSTRPTLDAVVFDAGGTLVRLDFEGMAEDLVRHGCEVSAATLRRAEVQGRRDYDASRGADRTASSPLGMRGDIRAYFGGMVRAAGASDAMIEPAVDRFLAREKRQGLWTRPMEGAREAIDALGRMGLRMAVVSNSDGRAEFHLVHSGVRDGMEFVVDSHLVGVEKPDPRIFAIALEKLGTAPRATLFVGDIRSVDEAGAAAAGMRFVLIDPYGDYASPGAPRVAGMHELATWVGATFATPRPVAPW